jgi:hypothetical protein
VEVAGGGHQGGSGDLDGSEVRERENTIALLKPQGAGYASEDSCRLSSYRAIDLA